MGGRPSASCRPDPPPACLSIRRIPRTTATLLTNRRTPMGRQRRDPRLRWPDPATGARLLLGPATATTAWRNSTPQPRRGRRDPTPTCSSTPPTSRTTDLVPGALQRRHRPDRLGGGASWFKERARQSSVVDLTSDSVDTASSYVLACRCSPCCNRWPTITACRCSCSATLAGVPTTTSLDVKAYAVPLAT